MEYEECADLKVWTSHMRRTIQTAEFVKCSRLDHWKALDELNAVSFPTFCFYTMFTPTKLPRQIRFLSRAYVRA